MYSIIKTAVSQGMESIPVSVETNISEGMPVFEMVGFLSSEVREARERVRVALQNSGISLPPKRITINFMPADVRKSGTAMDLAVAASVLCAMGCMDLEIAESSMFVGEVSLSGEITSVRGVLSAAILAGNLGLQRIFVPEKNKEEAGICPGVHVVPVRSLKDLIRLVTGTELEKQYYHSTLVFEPKNYDLDFSEVKGQTLVRRACEIAVSGRHNLLMIGPPGSGKTMIARRIPTIFPDLEWEEMLELSQIYGSCEHQETTAVLQQTRPFRSPHHTITPQGLCGGGKNPVPGEISLAHKGVLFLDEFPEFPKNLIDMLRQPMEEKQIRISRVGTSVSFPCDFMLVAAMNPCKCGYYPDMSRCRCTPASVHSYINHISQPMLDRMDMTVETRALSVTELMNDMKVENSESIRNRVLRAREIQKERFRGKTYDVNTAMSPSDTVQYCAMDGEARSYLMQVSAEQEFSTRVYYKILRVARTIADLDESERVREKHLMEACIYRSLDRKYWGRMGN